MRRSLRIMCVCGVAVVPAACAAPAIIATAGFGALQTGTEAFIRGELEAAVAHPIAEVFQAAQDAMLKLEFSVRAAKIGDANAYVVARETQGRKIDIGLEMKSKVVTKINVRVGVFGDQAVSRLILATIQSKLDHQHAGAEGAPAPTP